MTDSTNNPAEIRAALERDQEAEDQAMTSEATIERYLVKRVRALGGEIRKVQWIGHRGAPDRYVMIPPGLHDHIWGDFWVELKATGIKPEAHQLREHSRMRAAGVQVYVIDSIAAVDEVLR